MKYFLMILMMSLFIFLKGCKSQREYVFPQKNRIEIQRVCRFIKTMDTNRFMVLLGKIYPLNNDGYTAPIKNLKTSLEDAGYFCGRSTSRNFHCPKIVIENLHEEGCVF